MSGLDDKAGSEKCPLGVDAEVGCPPLQISRYQELHVVVLYPSIRIEVLAPGVGVDRHLSRLASADGRDEVQGNAPALLSGKIEGSV
jgi:hypothetical protein